MRLDAAREDGLTTGMVRGAKREDIPAILATGGVGAEHAPAARRLKGNIDGGEWLGRCRGAGGAHGWGMGERAPACRQSPRPVPHARTPHSYRMPPAPLPSRL